MNHCCLFVVFSLKFLTALIFLVAINSLMRHSPTLTHQGYIVFHKTPQISVLLSYFLLRKQYFFFYSFRKYAGLCEVDVELSCGIYKPVLHSLVTNIYELATVRALNFRFIAGTH